MNRLDNTSYNQTKFEELNLEKTTITVAQTPNEASAEESIRSTPSEAPNQTDKLINIQQQLLVNYWADAQPAPQDLILTLKEFILYRTYVITIFHQDSKISNRLAAILLNPQFQISDLSPYLEELRSLNCNFTIPANHPFKIHVPDKFNLIKSSKAILNLLNPQFTPYLNYTMCDLIEAVKNKYPPYTAGMALFHMIKISKIQLNSIQTKLAHLEQVIENKVIKILSLTEKFINITKQLSNQKIELFSQIKKNYDDFIAIEVKLHKTVNNFFEKVATTTLHVNKEITKVNDALKEKENVDILLRVLNNSMPRLQKLQIECHYGYSQLDRDLHAYTWFWIHLCSSSDQDYKKFSDELLTQSDNQPGLFILKTLEDFAPYEYAIDSSSNSNRLQQLKDSLKNDELFSSCKNLLEEMQKLREDIRTLYGSFKLAFIPTLSTRYESAKSSLLGAGRFQTKNLANPSSLEDELTAKPSPKNSSKSHKSRKQKSTKKKLEAPVKTPGFSPEKFEAITPKIYLSHLAQLILNQSLKNLPSFEDLKPLLIEVKEYLKIHNKTHITYIMHHMDNASFHIVLLEAYAKVIDPLISHNLLGATAMGHMINHLNMEQTLRFMKCITDIDLPLGDTQATATSKHNLQALCKHCGFQPDEIPPILTENEDAGNLVRYPYNFSHKKESIAIKLQNIQSVYLNELKRQPTNEKKDNVFIEQPSFCQSYVLQCLSDAFPLLEYLISLFVLEPIPSSGETKKMPIQELIDHLENLLFHFEKQIIHTSKQAEAKTPYVKNAYFHLTLLHSCLSLLSKIDPSIQALGAYGCVFSLQLIIEQLLLAYLCHRDQQDALSHLSEYQIHDLYELAILSTKMAHFPQTSQEWIQQFRYASKQIRYPFYLEEKAGNPELRQFLINLKEQITFNAHTTPFLYQEETLEINQMQTLQDQQKHLHAMTLDMLTLQKKYIDLGRQQLNL